MKIGTVTYWWSPDNYGQVLQCFALVRFLRMMGHDAFLIKYRPEACPRRTPGHVVASMWRYATSPGLIRTRSMWRRLGREMAASARLHPRGFDAFRAAHIPSTPVEYGTRSLMATPPAADAYVCGSDQIWGSPHPIYFLQFAPPGTKRVAYAPSMGGLVPRGKARRLMARYLSGFDLVSSREAAGVDALRAMGRPDTVRLPDPTLLLPVETYRSLARYTCCPDGPYMLAYLLGNETEVSVDALAAHARSLGLSFRYVASQGRADDHPKCYPTVEEWLGLVERAALVVTNSFHGTVFCLQFNTPFVVLPIKGSIARMNNRITDLLGTYGLIGRIYSGRLPGLSDGVDFTAFNRRRAEEADEVEALLARTLSGGKD